MAIKANELRIGNWVSVDGKSIQVESINEDGINQEISSGWYGSWDTEYEGRFYDWHKDESRTVQPIPITEDILIKCGFEEIDGDKMFPYFQKRITMVLDEYKFDISTRGDNEWRWIEGNVNVPFCYLHQLQNLYFSLTGEELKIEL